MDADVIRHSPRHINHTILRRVEIERDILNTHDGVSAGIDCPDCGCVMVYRGIGRLRNGSRVHYYECIHSHREVHSLSVVITE